MSLINNVTLLEVEMNIKILELELNQALTSSHG